MSDDDQEAARLLRELAANPRQGVIWPHHHGRWSTNTLTALARGRAALNTAGRSSPAARLTWVAEHPGACLSAVLASRQWPGQAADAMHEAAELLEPSHG